MPMVDTALPHSLVAALRTGRVVPFVGAGVSMSVLRRDGSPAFPSWRDLLLSSVENLELERKSKAANLVRALVEIEEPDMLHAAKKAQDGLGPEWYGFLERAFGLAYGSVEPASLQLPSLIWRLGSPLVITTNYDRVLQWACPWSEDLRIWSVRARSTLTAAHRFVFSRPVVWHIHGHLDCPEDLILTPDGYTELYGDVHVEALYAGALDTIRHILAARTVLFIGFSFSDPYLRQQLKWLARTFAGAAGTHYMLVRAADVPMTKSLITGLPIQTVTFEEFGQPLLDLLRTLVTVAAPVRWTEDPSGEVAHGLTNPSPELQDDLGLMEYDALSQEGMASVAESLGSLATHSGDFSQRMTELSETHGGALDQLPPDKRRAFLEDGARLLKALADAVGAEAIELRRRFFLTMGAMQSFLRLAVEDLQVESNDAGRLLQAIEALQNVIGGAKEGLATMLDQLTRIPRWTAAVRQAREQAAEVHLSLLNLLEEMLATLRELGRYVGSIVESVSPEKSRRPRGKKNKPKIQ